jgi:hypothetical protein
LSPAKPFIFDKDQQPSQTFITNSVMFVNQQLPQQYQVPKAGKK